MGAEQRHISLGWGFFDLIASLPCFDCRKFDRTPWWFIVSFIKNANIWLLDCSFRFLTPQQSCNSWGLRFTRCSVSAKQGCQQSAAFTDGCKTRKSSCRRDVPEGVPTYPENVPSASPHCLFTVRVITISIPPPDSWLNSGLMYTHSEQTDPLCRYGSLGPSRSQS